MVYFISMIWTVTATKKVEKRFKKLPHKIKAVLYVLIAEIRIVEINYVGTHEKAPY